MTTLLGPPILDAPAATPLSRDALDQVLSAHKVPVAVRSQIGRAYFQQKIVPLLQQTGDAKAIRRVLGAWKGYYSPPAPKPVDYASANKEAAIQTAKEWAANLGGWAGGEKLGSVIGTAAGYAPLIAGPEAAPLLEVTVPAGRALGAGLGALGGLKTGRALTGSKEPVTGLDALFAAVPAAGLVGKMLPEPVRQAVPGAIKVAGSALKKARPKQLLSRLETAAQSARDELAARSAMTGRTGPKLLTGGTTVTDPYGPLVPEGHSPLHDLGKVLREETHARISPIVAKGTDPMATKIQRLEASVAQIKERLATHPQDAKLRRLAQRAEAQLSAARKTSETLQEGRAATALAAARREAQAQRDAILANALKTQGASIEVPGTGFGRYPIVSGDPAEERLAGIATRPPALQAGEQVEERLAGDIAPREPAARQLRQPTPQLASPKVRKPSVPARFASAAQAAVNRAAQGRMAPSGAAIEQPPARLHEMVKMFLEGLPPSDRAVVAQAISRMAPKDVEAAVQNALWPGRSASFPEPGVVRGATVPFSPATRAEGASLYPELNLPAPGGP